MHAQVGGNLLCERWVFVNRFVNRCSKKAILGGVLTVTAIRAVVHKPRPIDGDEPENTDGKKESDTFYAGTFHIDA